MFYEKSLSYKISRKLKYLIEAHVVSAVMSLELRWLVIPWCTTFTYLLDHYSLKIIKLAGLP